MGCYGGLGLSGFRVQGVGFKVNFLWLTGA